MYLSNGKKLFSLPVIFFLFFALNALVGCSSSGSVKKKPIRYEPKAAYKHKRLTPVYKAGRQTTGDSSLQKELVELKGSLSKQDAETKDMRDKFNRESDKLRSELRDCRNNVKTLTQKCAGEEAKLAEEEKKSSLYHEMTQKLSDEIKNKQVTISELQNKLTVDILNQVLFEKGSADISEDGMDILQKVSDVVKKAQDKEIRIEGHTDSDKIWSKRLRRKYDSNWELSTTRATNVLRALVEKNGIDPKRIYAAGYGEFRPVASNETPEGKAKNRRIDIVVVSR